MLVYLCALRRDLIVTNEVLNKALELLPSHVDERMEKEALTTLISNELGLTLEAATSSLYGRFGSLAV